MGVWGTAVFSDDTASDIRGDYRDYLGAGLSGPEATARILAEYKSSLADPPEAGVVWLALAATQWKLGRIEPQVLERALEVIDSGSDLKRWEAGTADFAKRRAVLEKLRAQLILPQPAAKRVPKQIRSECDWNVGDLVSYRLLSGKLIVFRVIGHHTDKGGTYPICEILDWVGDGIPPVENLRAAGIRTSRTRFNETITKLMIVGIHKKAPKQMERLNLHLEPAQTKERSSVVHRKELDKFLGEWFLLD